MKSIKFWIAGVVAAGAVVAAVLASVQSMAMEFVEVAQVTDAAHRGQRVKVSAKVVAETTQLELDMSGRTVLRFKAVGPSGATVDVYHLGPKPDAFADGGVVLLEGSYRHDLGRFDAEVLHAKCPSRYEEEAPAGYKKPGKNQPAGKPVKQQASVEGGALDLADRD